MESGIKNPTQWKWREGPLPNVNDAPDLVRVVAWIPYDDQTAGYLVVFCAFTGESFKKTWVSSSDCSSLFPERVKCWAVVSGLEFEEWAIKEIIE